MWLSRFLLRWFPGRDTCRERDRFRPAVEGLESRWNPANVTASVVNGVLTLSATAGAFNDVIQISTNAPGEIEIEGTGTTINGSGSTAFSGIRSIDCFTKGGDDTVSFNGD